MSSYTMGEARDAVIAHFVAEWAALGFDAANVLYQNRRSSAPTEEVIWCRYQMINDNSRKASLTNANGVACYERHAFIVIQLFFPLDGGLDDDTTQSILDVYEGGVPSISGIWFNDTSAREIGPDNNWFQTNVTTKMMYNQVK